MSAKSSAITVSMRSALGLLESAAGQGVAAEDLLARAGIDRSLLGIARARISLKQFSRLYAGIASALEDEGLGLFSVPVRPGATETFCRVGATTATLGECLQVMARACNAAMGGYKVECVAEDGELQIRFSERLPDTPIKLLAYEITLLSIYAVLSWLVGQRLPLAGADFPCAPPRHRFESHALLAGPARFDRPCGALRFPAQAAALHVVRNADEIPRFIRRAPASFIEALLVGDTLASDVRHVLQQALPTLLSLPQVAEQLALSPRTLHRKLEAGGASFQQIKDNLRRDMALHLLNRGRTPLKQIATSLGFSDQSTFQRAFAQWTGVAPGEYRRRTKATLSSS